MASFRHMINRTAKLHQIGSAVSRKTDHIELQVACCMVRSCSTHHAFRPFDSKLLHLPLARYGGRQTVTVLPGDGIGPEMLSHVKRVFKVANVPVDFEDIPLDSMQAAGNEDLENALTSIERNGVALKGNIETKVGDANTKSRNVELRARLDLYANVLRCKSYANVPAKYNNLDIVLIRENTEGEYSGIEHETIPGVVESLKIVTRTNITRIAKFAFDLAVKHGRKKVTAIHKANIMKLGDGLFLRVCEEVSRGYPEIEFNNMIIDNASMQLVSNPHQFDIMLMPNLYGNIISNIGCGIVGGPGLVSGVNIGDKYAVFETGTRNTGTNLVGKDVANPTAFFSAAIDMLFYLGFEKRAKMLRDGIHHVVSDLRIHTPDVGGSGTTTQYIDALLKFADEHTAKY